MKPTLQQLISEHRQGMQYLGELRAYIEDVANGQPGIRHVQQMDGLSGTTVYDELGNVIYSVPDDTVPDYIKEQPHPPLTHAHVDTATFSEVFPDTYEFVQNLTSFPSDLLGSAKKAAIWGIAIVTVIVVAPHVIDYMASRNNKRK